MLKIIQALRFLLQLYFIFVAIIRMSEAEYICYFATSILKFTCSPQLSLRFHHDSLLDETAFTHFGKTETVKNIQLLQKL